MFKEWRRWVYWLVVLELVSVVAFIGLLLLGETRRLTLIAMYLPRLPLLLATLAGGAAAKLGRRRVRELVAANVVLGLIVLFPVMGFTVSSSNDLDKPIRLTTYNVWFGRAGRPQLVEELVAMPADILLIQASYGSLGETLKKRLPDREIREDEELTIVSRWPIRDTFLPPPLKGTDVDSMFAKYVIDTPQGALRLVSLHAYSPRHALGGADDARENIASREAQVHDAVTAAREDVPPFIVAGDTNLPAMSAIRRRQLGGLHDAFDEVGTGFGYTFPANHPWMRIDRVLASDGVKFGTIEVAPQGASDHRAVTVTFSLSP